MSQDRITLQDVINAYNSVADLRPHRIIRITFNPEDSSERLAWVLERNRQAGALGGPLFPLRASPKIPVGKVYFVEDPNQREWLPIPPAPRIPNPGFGIVEWDLEDDDHWRVMKASWERICSK